MLDYKQAIGPRPWEYIMSFGFSQTDRQSTPWKRTPLLFFTYLFQNWKSNPTWQTSCFRVCRRSVTLFCRDSLLKPGVRGVVTQVLHTALLVPQTASQITATAAHGSISTSLARPLAPFVACQSMTSSERVIYVPDTSSPCLRNACTRRLNDPGSMSPASWHPFETVGPFSNFPAFEFYSSLLLNSAPNWQTKSLLHYHFFPQEMTEVTLPLQKWRWNQ